MGTVVSNWTDVESTEVFPGIYRQAFTATDSTLVRYTYHPGCVFPVHQHPEEQVTVIHSGEIEFTVDGAPVVLRAGDIAVIPGGMPHGARVTASEVVITDNYIPSANRTPLQFSDNP